MTSNAEVYQVDTTRFGQHNVGRLDIAKDDRGALRVQICQYVTQGYPDVKHLLRGEASTAGFLELIFQRLSRDVIHHDIPMIRISKVIVDAGNAVVFQPGEIPNFAVKGIRHLDHLLWAEMAQVDLLDRDKPAMMIEVFCLVDDAKPTFTHFIEDAVALGEEHARTQDASSYCHRMRERRLRRLR